MCQAALTAAHGWSIVLNVKPGFSLPPLKFCVYNSERLSNGFNEE